MTQRNPKPSHPEAKGPASAPGEQAKPLAASGSPSDIWRGRWPEVRGKIRAAWNRLGDRELDQVAGHRDQLIDQIAQRTGADRGEVTSRIHQIEREVVRT